MNSENTPRKEINQTTIASTPSWKNGTPAYLGFRPTGFPFLATWHRCASKVSACEALANQRAATFCLKDNDIPSATEYMVKATALYTEWGALAIAELVKKKHAYLFNDQMTTSSTRLAIERTKRYNKYLAEQCRLAQSRMKSTQYS